MTDSRSLRPPGRTTELLLAHDDDRSPVLPTGADPVATADHVEPVPEERVDILANISANANQLHEQRWALVVTDDRQGEYMEGLVGELVARRAEEQRAEVITVRVPPGLDQTAALRWKDEVFPRCHGGEEKRRPRYLCILGDVDGVSLATQDVLAVDGCPGRLVCDGDEGYQAYAAKVVARAIGRERASGEHGGPRSLFYTVHDGTEATASGYHKLMRPCFERCTGDRQRSHAEFPASTIEENRDDHDSEPDEFLDLARDPRPTVLFSLSHGLGPPRRRPWSRDQARERQGAMSFGVTGAIGPADIAARPFLPGGIWLYLACFGAGTPSESAYRHWVKMLAEHDAESTARLRMVMAGLARDGGFTSGLARAALSNPDGPLSVIGHMDLAWSYSYEPLRVDDGDNVVARRRSQHFQVALAKMVQGERVGAAFLSLRLQRWRVGEELNARYDLHKQAGADPEGASERDRVALSHLWMLRQDLSGYVVLGDPAARLPLAPETTPGSTTGAAGFGFQGGFQGGSQAPSASARQPGGPSLASQFAARGERRAHSTESRTEMMERAVHQLFAGRPVPEIVAEFGRALDIDEARLERWRRAYRQAGLDALTRLARDE